MKHLNSLVLSVVMVFITFAAKAASFDCENPLGTYSFTDKNKSPVKVELRNKDTDIIGQLYGDAYITYKGRGYLAKWSCNKDLKINGSPYVFIELLKGTKITLGFPAGTYRLYTLILTPEGYVYPTRSDAIDSPADRLKFRRISGPSKKYSQEKPATGTKQYTLVYEAKGRPLSDFPDVELKEGDVYNTYERMVKEIEKSKKPVKVYIPSPTQFEILDIVEMSGTPSLKSSFYLENKSFVLKNGLWSKGAGVSLITVTERRRGNYSYAQNVVITFNSSSYLDEFIETMLRVGFEKEPTSSPDGSRFKLGKVCAVISDKTITLHE